ncbi:MAG: hypothetical protein GX790_06325 [Syntrophomonadaceae bacterium]|nr:hypothetical protein [Syntrophomonadaceae bacterium]
MTELQQTFLMYTLIYFIVKGGLYVALYVATIIVEKHARDRYAQLRVYLHRKRKEEEKRWAVAYNKLNNRKQDNKEMITLSKAS